MQQQIRQFCCGVGYHITWLSAVLWHKLMCVVVHMYVVEPGSHHVTKPGPPDDDLENCEGVRHSLPQAPFCMKKTFVEAEFCLFFDSYLERIETAAILYNRKQLFEAVVCIFAHKE